jgi:hypothetical protein
MASVQIRRGDTSGKLKAIRKLSPPAGVRAVPAARKGAPLVWLGLGAVVFIGVLAALIFAAGTEPAPVAKPADAAKVAKEPAAVAPRPEAPPVAAEPRRAEPAVESARALAWRVNLLYLAAEAAARSGSLDRAREARERLAVATEDLARSRSGQEAPEHFRPGDVLTHFDHKALASLDPAKASRLLAGFLSELKAGARVRVACDRDGRRTEFTVFFEDRPKEAADIARWVASAPPPAPRSEPVAATVRAEPVSVRAAVPPVAEPAKSDTALFVAWAGSRPESKQPAWEAYLRQAPAETADQHLAIARQLLEKGKESPLFRWAALAHLLETGDESRLAEGGFRRSPDGKVWGDADQILHYRSARQLSQEEGEDAAVESAAKGGAPFGTRYAAVLAEMRKALTWGARLEATYNLILQASTAGGPAGAADHLKALAAAFKLAVCCKECKNGRVACPQCQGKTRVDLDCATCQGKGRVRPTGAVGNTDVTVKCRNCDGKKVFRDVGCPGCSRSGSVKCPSCKGKPWHDGLCAVEGCSGGRVRCTTCRGTGKEKVDCPFCEGGRQRAPGAVGNANVTQKCRNCEINGQTGTGWFLRKCAACNGSGRTTCPKCGGLFSRKEGEADKGAFPISAVFSTDRCDACAGSGWPLPRMALACPRCQGLGVRVKPAGDPGRTLE